MAKKRQPKLNIKEAIKKPDALRKELGTKEGKKVNVTKAKKKLSELRKAGKSGSKLGQRLNFFLNVLKPLANKRKSSHSLLK